MTRLYAFLAAIGAALIAALVFMARALGASREREGATKKTAKANAAARERIDNAIRPDDTADDARDRLRARNARNK